MIFLIILFVLVCILLAVAILLQSGKGGGLSGTFGGSGEFAGGRAAATFLTRATTVLAATFMVLCIIISIVSQSRLATEDGPTQVQQEMSEPTAAPVAPVSPEQR